MARPAGTMDLATGGPGSPVRRIALYYVILVGLAVAMLNLFPATGQLLWGERRLETTDLRLAAGLSPVATTILVLAGAFALALPVTWVYLFVRRPAGYAQPFVQTLLLLPVVLAGIVLVLRDELPVALGFAGIVIGIVAGERLRAASGDSRETSDARDAAFVLLAIGIGIGAGAQSLAVAALLSVACSALVLGLRHTDFGRGPLGVVQAAERSVPAGARPASNGTAASAAARAAAGTGRSARVRDLLRAPDAGRKARYNAVLKVTTESPAAAQQLVEPTLDAVTKRWRLDEIESVDGRPAVLYYLVRLRRSRTQDEVLGEVLARAGDSVLGVELELGPELTMEGG